MKKLTTLLAVMAMVFGLSGKAQAVPMYYTFTGTVTGISTDNAGIISAAGLAVGSTVTYTFIVDFDADGTITYNDGSVVTYTDDANNDYFYSDYFSGDALEQVGGGADGSWQEYNRGFDSNSGILGYLSGNSGDSGNFGDDWITIYSYTSNASDWALNDTMLSNNEAYDSSAGANSRLYSDLTLSDISPVNQVPEPATILLLGSGLIGLGFFRRKREAA